MMIQVTLDDVKAQLTKLGNTNRCNPVQGCWYTASNGDHCLAAQALVNLGVSVPTSADGVYNGKTIFNLVNNGWWGDDAEFDPAALALLQDAQFMADAPRNDGCSPYRPWRSVVKILKNEGRL